MNNINNKNPKNTSVKSTLKVLNENAVKKLGDRLMTLNYAQTNVSKNTNKNIKK